MQSSPRPTANRCRRNCRPPGSCSIGWPPESGTTRTVDPWGGSAYVERLTRELAGRAWAHIEEVEKTGGMAKAIDEGLPKMRIEEAAARTQARIDSGRQALIGVNKYPLLGGEDVEVLKVDNADVLRQQVARLAVEAEGPRT